MKDLEQRFKEALNRTETEKFVGYVVTGLLYNSTERFKPIRREKLRDALQINLWNGSIWALRKNGTRKLIKRVIN